MPSTTIALEQVGKTSLAAEPTHSAGHDLTPAISMLSAPPTSENTDQSLLDEQQPVMPLVHDIPVFQDDGGINPSFLQSEGWGGSRDTMIPMSSILADLGMDDRDCPNDGGIAIPPESPVVPQNDMEMRREAGVCNDEDEEQMSRQSPVDPVDDDVAMESLVTPGDVEMRDATDEVSEPLDNGVDEYESGKCRCLQVIAAK